MSALTPALKGDAITGTAVTLVGAIYYIATFSIQETKSIVTPRTFPAIVGVALIILGIFLLGQALHRGRKLAEAAPSPGPPSAGGSGSAVSNADVRHGAAASAGDEGHGTATPAEEASGVVLEAPEDPPSKKVVWQFALFFVYLAILIPVGFLLATTAFLMTMTSIYAPHRWVRNLIFSVLFAVAVYVAFVYGLAVYLPVGILG